MDVLGAVSATVTIVQGTIQVYDIIKKVKNLPQVFEDVGENLQSTNAILQNVQSRLGPSTENLDEDDKYWLNQLLPTAKTCEKKAKELEDICKKFANAIKQHIAEGEDDSKIHVAWNNVKKRYIAVANKGGKVEKLMEELLRKVQILFEADVIRRLGNTNDDIRKIMAMIRKLDKAEPSVSDEEMRNTDTTTINQTISEGGTGNQYNNTGNGSQHNYGGVNTLNQVNASAGPQYLDNVKLKPMTTNQVKRNKGTDGEFFLKCCEWFFDTEEFKVWIDARRKQQILLVEGGAGMGKSMLMCNVIDRLREETVKSSNDGTESSSCFHKSGPCTVIHFFVNDFENHKTSSVLEGLLRCCFDQHPGLRQESNVKHQGKVPLETSDIDELFDLADQVFHDLAERGALIIAIDALDEISDNGDERRDFLKWISRTACEKIKFIMSSRPQNQVTDLLLLRSVESEGRQVYTMTAEGVDTYLDEVKVKVFERLRTHKRHDKRHDKGHDSKRPKRKDERAEERGQSILDHLRRNTDRTFLWVAMIIKELFSSSSEHMHPDELVQEVKKLPMTLQDLYRKMTDRCLLRNDNETLKSGTSYRHLPYRVQVLGLLIASKTVLRVSECISLIDWTTLTPDMDDCEPILRECQPLIDIIDVDGVEHIRLVHLSAKEYLVDKYKDVLFPDGTAPFHHEIAMRSLNAMYGKVLTLSLYENMPSKDEPSEEDLCVPHAIAYCCTHWVDHLRESYTQAAVPDVRMEESIAIIHGFLQVHLLHWLEAMVVLTDFWTCESVVADLVRQVVAIQAKAPPPPDPGRDPATHLLESIELLRDTRRCLRESSRPIISSPSQIYLSMLQWTPVGAKIRSIYGGGVPDGVEIWGPLQEIWPVDQWELADQQFEGFAGRDRFVTVSQNHHNQMRKLVLHEMKWGGSLEEVGEVAMTQADWDSKLGVAFGYSSMLVTLARGKPQYWVFDKAAQPHVMLDHEDFICADLLDPNLIMCHRKGITEYNMDNAIGPLKKFKAWPLVWKLAANEGPFENAMALLHGVVVGRLGRHMQVWNYNKDEYHFIKAPDEARCEKPHNCQQPANASTNKFHSDDFPALLGANDSEEIYIVWADPVARCRLHVWREWIPTKVDTFEVRHFSEKFKPSLIDDGFLYPSFDGSRLTAECWDTYALERTELDLGTNIDEVRTVRRGSVVMTIGRYRADARIKALNFWNLETGQRLPTIHTDYDAESFFLSPGGHFVVGRGKFSTKIWAVDGREYVEAWSDLRWYRCRDQAQTPTHNTEFDALRLAIDTYNDAGYLESLVPRYEAPNKIIFDSPEHPGRGYSLGWKSNREWGMSSLLSGSPVRTLGLNTELSSRMVRYPEVTPFPNGIAIICTSKSTFDKYDPAKGDYQAFQLCCNPQTESNSERDYRDRPYRSYSPDGRFIAVFFSQTHMISVIDTKETPQTCRCFSVREDDKKSKWGYVKISSDGQRVVCWSFSGDICVVYNVQSSGNQIKRHVHLRDLDIGDITFSTDGKYVAVLEWHDQSDEIFNTCFKISLWPIEQEKKQDDQEPRAFQEIPCYLVADLFHDGQFRSEVDVKSLPRDADDQLFPSALRWAVMRSKKDGLSWITKDGQKLFAVPGSFYDYVPWSIKNSKLWVYSYEGEIMTVDPTNTHVQVASSAPSALHQNLDDDLFFYDAPWLQ